MGPTFKHQPGAREHIPGCKLYQYKMLQGKTNMHYPKPAAFHPPPDLSNLESPSRRYNPHWHNPEGCGNAEALVPCLAAVPRGQFIFK